MASYHRKSRTMQLNLGFNRTTIHWEDLIICIAIWTLYKLWPPLPCGEFREIPIASPNKLRFTSLLGPIFKDFGSPNGVSNSIFQAFFSTLFFNAFEHPILMDFWRLWIRKIAISPRGKQWFLQNKRFRSRSENCSMLRLFSEAKTKKIYSKIESKNVLFLSIELERFFPWF